MLKKATFLVALLFLLLFPAAALAHPGRTDGSGGHYDYDNVSGLGEYHYHHGYEAHLHTNGRCPYYYDDQTDHSTGASSGSSDSSGSTLGIMTLPASSSDQSGSSSDSSSRSSGGSSGSSSGGSSTSQGTSTKKGSYIYDPKPAREPIDWPEVIQEWSLPAGIAVWVGYFALILWVAIPLWTKGNAAKSSGAKKSKRGRNT